MNINLEIFNEEDIKYLTEFTEEKQNKKKAKEHHK